MLLRRNCFLCTQSPKISVLLFNDGLDMRMDNFSCRHSLHIFSPGAYGFTFFIISHLMLSSVFFFFNFQMWSLRVVVVLLCSSLNDDLCRLNLVLNSFSVSPMYVSCFFVSVSVTVALYTTHLMRHFPSSGQLFFFCRQLHNLSFWGDSFFLCICSRRLLLLDIVCFTFGRQL